MDRDTGGKEATIAEVAELGASLADEVGPATPIEPTLCSDSRIGTSLIIR